MFATLFIVLCCGALLGATSALDCPKICPALYAPVCATDGRIYQEFANACQLEVSKCNLHISLTTTHMDWCRTEFVGSLSDLLTKKFKHLDTEKPECLRPCDRIYEPLCMSNGKYRAVAPNKCLMDNLNCALGKSDAFRVLQTGNC